MSVIKLRKNDKWRPLLTEVLPYETPLFFSNEGFYRAVVEDAIPNVLKEKAFKCFEKRPTRPYLYRIRKGNDDIRELALMHPASQMDVCDIYDKYGLALIHLCGKSPFSLRRPVSVGRTVFRPTDGLEGDNGGVYSSTYFEYKKYSFLHSFFDSYEWRQLEKRFQHYRALDISKCFGHIYTHSFSWAVQGKLLAKDNMSRFSFDDQIDRAMRNANDGETSGILVGPEFSRVFAEVIFQRIDNELVDRLSSCGLKIGVDYQVRRYIDDYFIFSTGKDVGHTVRAVLMEELARYKLYLNESKSEDQQSPFITPISMAKLRLADIVDTVFAWGDVGEGDNGSPGRDSASRDRSVSASHVVRLLKACLRENEIQLHNVSGYFLAAIKRKLQEIRPAEWSDAQRLFRLLYNILDVCWFICAIDQRVRTTYNVACVSLDAIQLMKGYPQEQTETLKKKVLDEASRILRDGLRRDAENVVENLNLLVMLRALGKGYRVSEEIVWLFVNKVMGVYKESEEGVEYFSVVSLLFYMGRIPKFSRCRKALLDHVLVRLHACSNPLKRADFLCLVLDLVACPYVSASFRLQVLDAAGVSPSDPSALVKSIREQTWFTDWKCVGYIRTMLEKKEYRAPYA